MKDNFWKNKKVFITGHTGFKGSWLTLYLNYLEALVTGFSLESYPESSLFNLLELNNEVDSLKGDIRNLSLMREQLNQAEPEIVFHLAAQSLVRPSYEDPVGTYSTNIMGTVNLLEAVRDVPSVKSVIVVTSDKCYENKEWIWGYREQDPMGGYDPYSSSKGCAELVTSAYRSSFYSGNGFPNVASVRAGNVIGGGDWAKDRLIPDAVNAFSMGHTPLIRSPEAIRPWQHVLEPLEGYMMLAKLMFDGKAEYAQGWNFGPADDDIKTVSWVMDKMTELWGDGTTWKPDKQQQPHEAGLLVLDHSLSKYKLGWKPRLHTENALEWVVEWYKTFYQKGNARDITLTQVKRYLNMGQIV